MSARFDLYCNGCGLWHTFSGNRPCECPECGTAKHLTDSAPTTSADGLAAFYGPDSDAPLGAAGTALR